MCSNTDTVTSMISQECQCEAQHSQGSKFIQVSFPFRDVLSYFSCCHPQCPWAQSRFGPWMPCGCRGSGLPQSPPCTDRLSEPPAASLSPAVQWRPRHSSGRMSAITQTPSCLCSLVLASESTAKSPQGIPAADRHHSCFTIPAATPHPPLRCPPQGALLCDLTHRLQLCSSALTIHSTQGQTQSWECLPTGTVSSKLSTNLKSTKPSFFTCFQDKLKLCR